MKRALAERAKQSHSPTPQSPQSNNHHHHHHQNAHVSTEPSPQPPTSSTSSPPRKIQRVSSSTTTTPLSPPQPPLSSNTSTKKRQRPSSSPPPPSSSSSSSDSEEEEEQKQNAFYLKHQNRALASELKSLKHSLKSLKKEKRGRYKEYEEIGEKLEELDCIWKEMECSVEIGLRQLQQQREKNHLNSRQGNHASSATKPEDEGGGDNRRRRTKSNNKNKNGDDDDGEDGDMVDTTSYILELLSKLSTSSSSPQFKKEEENDKSSSSDEQKSTEFISHTKNRATVFRDALFLLLKQVLHHDKDDGPLAEEWKVKKEKTVKKVEKKQEEEEEVVPKPRKRGRPPRRRTHEVIKEDSDDDNDENDTKEDSNHSAESNNNLNGEEGDEDVDIATKPFLITSLHKKINALQNTITRQKCQMKDLTKAKEDAVSNEWKVRRGLYRIASGRMNIKEVLKVVEKGDKGASFEEWFEKNAPAGSSTAAIPSVGSGAADGTKIGNSDTPVAATTTVPADGDKSALSTTEVAQLQKQIQDLKEITDCRDKKIKELLREREENSKRINSLMLSNSSETDKADDSSALSEDDVKRSSYYIETAAKLVSAQRLVKDLTRETDKIKERWGITKGDLENAKKTIVDIEGKHSRRWKILTEPLASAVADTEEGDSSSSKNKELYNGDKEDRALSATIMANFRQLTSNANKTVELQHKLRQALEGTRQVEMLRSSLADAHKMNESLQSKVDELRAKNAKFVAEKSAARASDSLGSSSSSERSSSRDHSSSSHRSSSGSSDRHSSSTVEKLQRDNRRLKKELVAALGSKDSARSKQERAEKERDSLMKTNARVLKQSSEKDDMNQKSLSTILHLKSVTEELIQEKEILGRKAKDAQQLALAARLAANAKERVEEEALKEKELAEEKLLDCQKQLRSLMEDKDQADGRLSQSKSQMISLVKELSTAKQRCDELASASTAIEEEKQRLSESLAITKKEAAEAAKKAASAAVANFSSGRGGGGSGNSEFTAEQLTTQVKVLKSRLACPVCNDRDKKCILLRCRHMFCHQCVDKNIKNRSRKCPACGQRFDMKDVGDVWL